MGEQPGQLELVGRESELDALREFLGRGGPALLLEGPAGIGKTSLFGAAIDQARRMGTRVLVARPSGNEAGLGLAGLTDLFDGIDLDGLAPPRRHALEAALLLRDAEPGADPRALNAAVLDLLRRLALQGPTVVAVDDLQWLDAATDAALAFAARRLAGADVRFLLTARTPRGARGALERALEPRLLALAPLSFGAIGRLVHERTGVRLSRALMRRVYEIAAGNPLFSLELARGLADGEEPIDGDMPLPSRIEELLEDRVIGLEPGVRTALLAVSLDPGLGRSELEAVTGEGAVEAGLAAGVLSFDGGRVRLSHPLLGEVAKDRLRARRRRELHGRLARAVTDPDRRALHLALAADGPDPALAAELAAAAARTERRGMLVRAADLSEHALRLTPGDDPQHDERLLTAARDADAVGRLRRSGELLRPVLERLEPGEMRARGMLLLADAAETSTEETFELFERAAAEAPADSPLRASALSRLALYYGIACVSDVERALSLATEAVRVTERTSDAAARGEARAIFAWMRTMRGLPVEAHSEPHSASDRSQEPDRDPEPQKAMHSLWRSLGVRHMWRGELQESRRLLDEARALAEERGEAEAYLQLRLQLCELELRRGDWDAVDVLLDEWERERDEAVNSDTALARCRALVAAGRGETEPARRWAREAIASARATGGASWQELEALRALGIVALLAREPEEAAVHLREVRRRTRDAGVQDPGAFPVAADLVAALAASGAGAEAREVAERLESLAQAQDHPWALAAATRARGLILAAEGDGAAAVEALAQARQRFEALDMRFSAARCELALGMALRRLRRLREAREALARAVAGFDALGSPGWAALARAEAARLGGRRSAGAELTPTEARVAQLVAQGLANKQVATELVVTVGAVEAHLTRIFGKLGVRSRTELARRLAAADRDSEPGVDDGDQPDARAEQSVGESPLPSRAGPP